MSAKPGWRSWRGATLKEMSGSRRSALQAAERSQTSSITQAPSSSISRVSSICGMNAPGASRPRSGCCQRTSASKRVVAPVARSTIGW